MKKYFVLYMAKGPDFKKAIKQMSKMTKEDREAMGKEWADWMKKTRVADGGAPLGKTLHVTAKKFKKAKNEIGGYSIIEANTQEEAAKKLQNNPHFNMIPKGWIEVMEILPM